MKNKSRTSHFSFFISHFSFLKLSPFLTGSFAAFLILADCFVYNECIH